jgi:hypothetical protein
VARRETPELGDSSASHCDRDGQVFRLLGATSINKAISRLGQILEDAVEYDLIPRNPARGKRRS